MSTTPAVAGIPAPDPSPVLAAANLLHMMTEFVRFAEVVEAGPAAMLGDDRAQSRDRWCRTMQLRAAALLARAMNEARETR
jgi:hypothetical protein